MAFTGDSNPDPAGVHLDDDFRIWPCSIKAIKQHLDRHRNLATYHTVFFTGTQRLVYQFKQDGAAASSLRDHVRHTANVIIDDAAGLAKQVLQ